MDTICGIGLPELIVLALVAFVVVGPERTRELALQMGRLLRRVMRSSWWKEFNQVAGAIRDLPTTLVRMAELEDELKNVRSDLERATHFDTGQPSTPGAQTQPPGIDLSKDPWGVGAQLPPPPPPGAPSEPPSQSVNPPADSEQSDHG